MEWTFKRSIDEVCVGLRCMVGWERMSFEPPAEDPYGPEFMAPEDSWGRVTGPRHREPLREIHLPHRIANIVEAKECVTIVDVVKTDHIDRLRPFGVVVRWEREFAGMERRFLLDEVALFSICRWCNGDGYYHGNSTPRFPCIECNGKKLSKRYVASFRCEEAGGRARLLDIDGDWPALPDLKEDMVKKARWPRMSTVLR